MNLLKKTLTLSLICISTIIAYAQEKEFKEYYDNGNLKQIGKYNPETDKEFGEWLVYYENGNLMEISNMKNGLLHGEQKLYYKNGKLKREGQFIEGKGEGLFKQYHEDIDVLTGIFIAKNDQMITPEDGCFEGNCFEG